MPERAPVATLISSLSHIVPTMLSLTSVGSPAPLNSAAMRSTRAVRLPSSSPMIVSLPLVPATTSPGDSSTPPTYVLPAST